MNNSEILLLRFDTDEDCRVASWIICAADGTALGDAHRDPLEHIGAHCVDRRVIGLIPASFVLSARVELPRASRKKQRLAVPYALEDRLAADPESLHFALSRPTNDANVSVDVVARDLLRTITERCAEAGIRLTALYADAACIAPKPGDVLGLLDNNDLHLRHPDGRRQTLPAVDLDAALRLAGVDAEGSAVLGFRLHGIDATPPSGYSALNVRGGAKYVCLNQGTLPWLASQLTHAEPIDLLQGEFEPLRGFASFDAVRWRAPIVAAAVLAVISLGLSLDGYRRERSAERAVDAALLDAGRSVLPQGTEAADAASLLRARVRTLSAINASPGLPAAAAAIASVGVEPKPRLNALSVDANSVECTLTLRDTSTLDALRTGLTARGWTTVVRASTTLADGLEAKLSLTVTGAKP